MNATAQKLQIKQTGHVGLNVTAIERAKDFYQKVFGFEVFAESNEAGKRFAFLGQNNQLFLTLWEQSDGEFPTKRPGLHHLSFEVADIDQVQGFEQRLHEYGIEPLHDGLVSHGEGASSGGIFFLDPDGIRLEIFSGSGFDQHDAAHEDTPTCGFF